jgi:glutamate 5-kinase
VSGGAEGGGCLIGALSGAPTLVARERGSDMERPMIVIVKIGTSSLTDDEGAIVVAAIAKLCGEVAAVRALGHEVVIVSSGAIGAGLPVLGLGGDRRPRDAVTLQAVSAVGQSRLVQVYNDALARHGLVAGQVLVTPLDLMVRRQYLQARGTLARLLELGVVPVVNENDAIADDEIRFGDNDRIAALVAHLVGAELLVLLTDTPGLFTADPRLDTDASLIEEIVEVDHALVAAAGGAGTDRGSGGMASKLAAAKIAAWSGVRTVIAAAHRERALTDAVAGEPGVGTVVVPHERRLPARKLWIAFAVGARGTVVVDDGARRALLGGGASLLAAGVTGVVGDFDADEPVEIAGPDGHVFAKGLVRAEATAIKELAGRRSADLPEGVAAEIVHRDDLVVLP